jgi:Na+/H+ antiporter NhaB
MLPIVGYDILLLLIFTNVLVKLVSKLLGHLNIAITSTYLESNQEMLMEEARPFM